MLLFFYKKSMNKIITILSNLIYANRREIFIFFASYFSKKYNFDWLSWDITKEEDYKQTDYNLENAWAEINLPALEKRNTIFVFDQGQDWRLRNSCVPLNIYLSFCHTLWITPDYKFFKEKILSYLEKNWLWIESKGASIPKVMDALRKVWNEENPEKQIIYFRESIDSPYLKEALQKGYRIVARYGTRKAFSLDRDDNSNIDSERYLDWAETWGHIVSLMSSFYLEWKNIVYIDKNSSQKSVSNFAWEWINVVDSYPTTRTKSNIYAHNKLKKQVENWIFSSWFYIIARKDQEIIESSQGEYLDIPKSSPDYDISLYAKKLEMSWNQWNLELDKTFTKRETLILLRRLEKILSSKK